MRRIYDDGGVIANTILQQLGGAGRLRAMTGAYNFVDLGNGLAFRLKNQRANYVKITLTSMDLYDVEVGRIRGGQYKVVDSAEGLYYEDVKPFIEKATGMYLSLYANGGFIKLMKKFDEGIEELRYKVDEDEMSIEVDMTTKDYLTGLGIVPERLFRTLRNTYIFWYDDLTAPELEELEDFLEDTFELKQMDDDEYGEYAKGGEIDYSYLKDEIERTAMRVRKGYISIGEGERKLEKLESGLKADLKEAYKDKSERELEIMYHQICSKYDLDFDAIEDEYDSDDDDYAKGGKVKKKRVRFVDKVESIADRLEGTKVPKRLKKDYGGRYNREEAEEAGRRIAGAQLRDKKIR